MVKAPKNTDPKVLTAFDAMISGVPDVARKGATMPYASINGNMYASISKANIIGLRLSKTDLAEFLETYQNGLYEGVPGHFMKEYVAISEDLLSNVGTLHKWFRKSHNFALGLKPKKQPDDIGR